MIVTRMVVTSGGDKDASEEDDEDIREHEGRFSSHFSFEGEAAYFQRYKGAVLPNLDGSGFSLKNTLAATISRSRSLIEKRLERITI
jgi:hypothetical protein